MWANPGTEAKPRTKANPETEANADTDQVKPIKYYVRSL